MLDDVGEISFWHVLVRGESKDSSLQIKSGAMDPFLRPSTNFQNLSIA